MRSSIIAPIRVTPVEIKVGIWWRDGEADGDTMTSRRITLLCWLLVLTMAAAAEGAWVLWLQDHWTADAHTVASPRPHLRVTSSEEIANGQSP